MSLKEGIYLFGTVLFTGVEAVDYDIIFPYPLVADPQADFNCRNLFVTD